MTNLEMKKLLGEHKKFRLNTSIDYDMRIKQLDLLKKMLKSYEDNIYDALKEDLNKSPFETLTTELSVLYQELDSAKKQLKEWMKPEKVKAPITHKGTTNHIYKEPYGTVLVISPWNYPIQLTIAPVIGAIAAGNTVVIKPSELAPTTSSLINKMIAKTFSADYVTVIEGDKTVNQQLLEQEFDYIFFTGSSKVGKIVMEKASQKLIPVTLELGGKSPAIINEDANIKLAAKRIVWGKFTNAGQTCVAPDYLYVHSAIKNKLLRAIIKQIKAFYGKKPLTNKDYVKIINQSHFKRLTHLLIDDKILYGGASDEKTLSIEPTLMDHITWQDAIMEEEIFGPILPILTFDNLDDVIFNLQDRDKPLALYYFGENEVDQEKIIASTSFGGGSINDTLYHLANSYLPFGGVGQSGMGAYHGIASFNTFTHEKSIMKQTTKFDLPFRYPGKIAHSVLKKFFR